MTETQRLEFFTKLLAALRSNRYVQGRTFLRSREPDGSSKHCVAGIMCDVSGFGQWMQSTKRGEQDCFMYHIPGDDTVVCVLPRSLTDALHIDQQQEAELESMSDDGQPFPDIADYIEYKVVPEIFV